MAEIYGFTVKDAQGGEIPLSDYAGKVLLIVNTATRCGLTPQYVGLQTLYRRYAAQGFEILDFPCGQFRNQAPESSGEIEQICRVRFGTQFRVFEKTEVNGGNAAPLFRYLKQQQPHDSGGGFKNLLLNLAAPAHAREHGGIKWNFTKFLVSRSGEVAARFAPAVAPAALENSIEALL